MSWGEQINNFTVWVKMHCTAKTVMISDDLSSITYPVSLVFEGHTARHANRFNSYNKEPVCLGFFFFHRYRVKVSLQESSA